MIKNLKIKYAVPCVFAVAILATTMLWSCTSDEPTAAAPAETEESTVTVKHLNSLSEVNNDFAAFLTNTQNPSSIETKSQYMSKDSLLSHQKYNYQWDTSKLTEVRSLDGLKMQATQTVTNNPNIIACSYWVENKEYSTDPTTLLFEETQENNFTLSNEDSEPVMLVKYNPGDNTISCMVVSKEAYSIFCGIGMATLGWEVATVLAVPSGGSSLAFGVLWSVVTHYACK